jgi:pilus assembly protein CpaB
MKKSRLAVLALAVVAAGGAYMLASTPKPVQVETAAPIPPPPPQTEDVLVASKDLALGIVVGDAEMAWQPWPKSGVASGMIVRSSDPKVMDDIRGSIVRASFFKGEPIHREKLIKGTNSGFMSAILPSGMRAVAINIDSQGATTAGGFILPNDRVDVIRTFHDDSVKGANTNTFTSETLLRNVRVLAIGQNVQEKNGQPVVVGSNATLELDPVQAETVVLAQRVGQLSLSLRSMLDANKTPDAAAQTDKDVTVVRFGYAGDGAVR